MVQAQGGELNMDGMEMGPGPAVGWAMLWLVMAIVFKACLG